ncbi:MAG: hypothetical protein ACI845_002022 [Gammaproteobacteria bacterium]|jgi:hypothetical protein
MVAQEWIGSKLESSVYFEPDDQGLDLFTAYLKSFKNEPIRLLVDLIEEEFRQIKIPLLRWSDRKAILKRNYIKYFRNSEYRFAISQSVEKKGRKEEKLLLIGLTNQFLLEPWLKIIEDTKTPLSGILSLPLVSESYVTSLETESRVLILVSQQVPSNLRQSVFIDGKLILSRLVPIASFYQGDYTSDVFRDIESTQRYLISQRIVERSERVEVHILTNKRHLDKLTVRGNNDQFFDFQIHEINDVLEKQKIEIFDEQDFSSGLYCFTASKKLSVNHYAQVKERRYFQLYKANLILKAASIAFLTISIGLAIISGGKGLLYGNTIAETDLIEQKYHAKYNQLSETMVDSSTSTLAMKNIVQTVEEINQKYLHNPEELMSLVSQNVSLFPDIRVKRIEWFVANNSALRKADDVNWGKPKKITRKRGDVDKNMKAPKQGLFEVAIVEGEFINFDGNYRYSLSAVDDLEKAMIQSENYYSVDIIKRPLDIESDNKLVGEVGVQTFEAVQTAEVAFRVVREIVVK